MRENRLNLGMDFACQQSTDSSVMKNIVVFGFIISLLWPAFAQTATAEDSSSLSHWLVPWYGELRPGGAVLIGANPIFDSDETTAETWFKPIS